MQHPEQPALLQALRILSGHFIADLAPASLDSSHESHPSLERLWGPLLGGFGESQAEQGSDISGADRREELMVPVLVHEVPH